MVKSSNQSITETDTPGVVLAMGKYQIIRILKNVVCFKAAITLSCIFLPAVLDKLNPLYELIILLSLLDYWMTKNVSGRVLVGLR